MVETPGNLSDGTTRLEAIGSAAAGIAHDINNHLTLILNYLELHDIDAARAAADRCCALTSGLLSYCRGETIAVSRLDPVPFLAEFIRSLRLPASVSLCTDLSPTSPAISADAGALTRVLTNLVSNACDAMGGSGVLRIRTSSASIQVEDSGPGIPEADRERVFQPFVTSKGTRGTGLGLAIARDLMRQQDGSLTLISEPGCGACFDLRFRLYSER